MAETDEAKPARVASIVHSNTSSGTVMAVCAPPSTKKG
jgi:hypothetical protein